MENDQMIPAEECCTHYNIEFSFISSLHESGLIEITTHEERRFIPNSQLRELEKFVRLHHDLNINLEGIEAIAHLLKRIEVMQDEMMWLKNRLRRFEE